MTYEKGNAIGDHVCICGIEFPNMYALVKTSWSGSTFSGQMRAWTYENPVVTPLSMMDFNVQSVVPKYEMNAAEHCGVVHVFVSGFVGGPTGTEFCITELGSSCQSPTPKSKFESVFQTVYPG